MAQMFRMVLSLSVSGGVVGLLILLLRPVTRRCFTRKWTYYLWLLVLVRLIVPVHVDANMMEYLSRKLAVMVSQQERAGGTDMMPDEAVVGGAEGLSQSEAAVSEAEGLSQSEAAANGAEGLSRSEAVVSGAEGLNLGETIEKGAFISANIYIIASLIWILGLFLSAALRMYGYRSFTREVCAGSVPVTDENVLVKSTEIQVRLRIGHRLPLYESTAVNSPMLIGLVKPYIILPSALLAEMKGRENDICLILHHELVHYKRRDIWYKWLFQAVLCIHWFNPLVYLFNRRFNVDCELACDEVVMALLSKEGREAYGNVLLDVAEKNFQEKLSLLHRNIPAMTLLEEKRTLKERLRSIAQYHKKGLMIGIVSVIVLAALTAAAVICGVSGAQSYAGQMLVLQNRGISTGILDSMVNQPMHIQKNGSAYRMYDDDTLIAGKCESDCWQARNYCGGGTSVDCQKFSLNGSAILWIFYVNKETEVEISSSFVLKDGRFKIVQVTPDGAVRTLNDTGEKMTGKSVLSEGRNCFKIVGQEARLEDLSVSYSGMETEDIYGVYRSEEEEYAFQVKAGEEPLDISRLEDMSIYLEEKDLSEIYRSIWQANEVLSDADWQDAFLYSDVKRTSGYLIEELGKGGIQEFDSRILCMIACYMEPEDVSECFRYLLEREKIAESDWEDIFIYSDTALSAKYLVTALRNGKGNGFHEKALGQICYRVSTKSLTDIVTALDREELTYNGLLEYVLPFVQKQDEAVICVCYYIDLGNVLTVVQLREIEGYVSEKDFYRIVEYNGERK